MSWNNRLKLSRMRQAGWLLAVVVMAAVARAAPAPVLLDEMNGDRPAFRLLPGSPGVHLVRQSIEHGDGRFGDAEHIALAIPAGASAPVGYSLPLAPVVNELHLEAWALCNRPGMQLAALVVLPRSRDARTGQSRQLLVRSEKPAGGSEWQRLELGRLRDNLERSARVARAAGETDVDTREAYVSHLVILVPGGAGVTELLVDRITMYGPLRPGGGEAGPSPVELASRWTGAESSAAVETGARLRARPALPRIIQWQGEPLEFLAQLGFDGVWMGRTPNVQELAEAGRLGLWVVCPPPSMDSLSVQRLGEEYAQVLAWDLGDLTGEGELELLDAWSREIARCDDAPDRPVMVRTLGMPREASRVADVLVLARPTVGATSTWLEYSAWLRQQRRLARPGAEVWIGVDTHATTNALAQAAAFGSAPLSPPAASYRHLAQATVAAMGVWPRGYLFFSASSLTATDPETRMRALALELTNLRLGLIEPWLARGKAAAPAQSSRPDVTAMVLTVERSHLVAPMQWGDAPFQEAPSDAGRLPQATSLILPGAPESCDAHVLTTAGLVRVATRRVTGGVSMTVPLLPDDSLVLLTEDGFAFSRVEQYVRRYAPRAAAVRLELAELTRRQAALALAQLNPTIVQSASPQPRVEKADAALQAARQALVAQDFAAAFAHAAEAERMLDAVKCRLFAEAWPEHEAGNAPFPRAWATLGDFSRMAVALENSNSAADLVPGGDFEDLEAWRQAGWRCNGGASPGGIHGAVRLSPTGAYEGGHALELEARTGADEAAPPAIAAPPVWVTSPPLTAHAGCLVEITGWVRLAEQPMGSADPLLIFDSLGGEESALRIASAPAWRPFRLTRVIPAGTSTRVTIALGGVGRAAIDSLRCRYVPLDMASPGVASNTVHSPPIRGGTSASGDRAP